MAQGMSRMRNFQRQLVADHCGKHAFDEVFHKFII
jgi:hypothetical protein